MKRNQISKKLSNNDHRLVQLILNETNKYNLDNISRTDAYFRFYQQHREIHWSFLASMVSRNAGWNMCDLEGKWFPSLLRKETRDRLFITYERANWIIFQDAFPQLLLYQYSTKVMQPMFHLLKCFHVSSFMEGEWNYFWLHKDYRRLLISLIINEQHVIHKPVIHHPFYSQKVFRSFTFFFQDWLHFSSVLLPTCNGLLYGASVSGFKDVHRRINLGKKIATILFNEQLYPLFYEFAFKTVHTGSRYDYECYFMNRKRRDTPFLRMVYPVVQHHIHAYEDWSERKKISKKWYKKMSQLDPIVLNKWFEHKQKQLHKAVLIKHLIVD
nr:DUF2515 family protein [Bacillus sp. V3B]